MTKKEINEEIDKLYEGAVGANDIGAALSILDRFRPCLDYQSRLEDLYKKAVDVEDYRLALSILDLISIEEDAD